MILPQFYVDDVIKRAISEDINYIDVASDYLLDENEKSNAKFIAKADGVLCGIEVAMRV
ncbi:MAG: nicotinate-nucleotide diphosphorylase (carboxylating), partial [Clostridia bacterium]|nr:nicotinate-nucleotide diphosphorylase (carboxylating) [Clostridia bacterium]